MPPIGTKQWKPSDPESRPLERSRQVYVGPTERRRGTDEQFRILAELAPAAVFICSEDRYRWANRATEAMTGYTADELLKISVRSTIHPDDALAFERAMADRLRSESDSSRFEYRLLRKDGNIVWVDFSATTVQYQATPAILATAVDITARRQAEEAVRTGEELFRNVIESSADIVTIIDDAGAIRYASPAVSRLLGWSMDELIGINAFSLLHPQDVQAALEGFRLGVEDYKKNPPIEVRVRQADGSYRLFEAASSHYYEKGVRIGLCCSFRSLHDRKQSELDLRESERKFRLLFEKNVAGVYLARLDGRILDCNDAAARIFGYEDRSGLLHTNADQLYDRPELRERFVQEILRRGNVHEIETQYRRADGSSVWVLESVSLLEPEPGAEVLLQGTLLDITERKRSEEVQAALYKIASLSTSPLSSNEYHRAIHLILQELMYAENMYIGVIDASKTKIQFLSFNDQLESNPVERPVGRGMTEYVLRRGEPLLADRSKATELEEAGEVELLGPDSFEWMGAPLRSGNETIGVLAIQNYSDTNRYSQGDLEVLNFVAQHISAAIERERNEKALRESEERMRALFQSAVHGIFLASIAADAFLEVNPAPTEMLGYASAEELKETKLSRDLFVRADEWDKLVAEARRQHRVDSVEMQWRQKLGNTITVRLSGRLCPADKGLPEALEMIVEDITERRMLEERLRHTQKMEAVGQLASGIAHEFNNLLTVINGYSELMMLHSETVSQDTCLGEIRRAASRAAELTRQLHTFTKHQEFSPQQLDLNALVTRIHGLLHRIVHQKATLELKLAPGLQMVHADPVSVEQVVMNLVVNARDALNQAGVIIIETSNSSPEELRFSGQLPEPGVNYVRLTVRDNGVGMSPEIRDRMFEPFFTTKKVGEGTGLGLSAVYGIVQQARGFISVNSLPGVGTAVTLFLPSKSTQGELRPGKATVLLVEDQEPVRSLVSEVLRTQGFNVLTASDPQEAVKVFEGNHTVDLLLTDVNLGEMSGTELAFRLTKNYPRLGILFTSGYLPTDEASADMLNDRNFLPKPFSAEALLTKVNQILATIRRD